MQKFVMAASDISLDYPQSNEIYFSVTMRMLTTEVNLNGVRLTAGFIDDIAEHAEEYICMPLCADIDRLSRGLDIGLTHMYDERRQMFEAPQVGSFFEVHRVEDEHGVSLVGTARINKRNADVTDKIIQMYNTGRLKFSFEIWASELYEEDGVTVVDAAPGNRLTAMAIVTTPALPAAVALNLAAEVDIDAFEHKVKKLLERKFAEDHWSIVWMGLEYTVVYFSDHGNMVKVAYRIDGDELIETESYEVRFDEVTKEMDNPNVEVAETTNVETPAVEETTAMADAVLNTDTVAEAAVEEETPCAETEAAACGDEEKAEVENDIDDDIKDESDSDAHDLEEMRLELERVNAELARYKAAEAEAKMAEKRAAARKYAEREHLNLEAENVKAAIENADYESLAAAVMEKPVENKDEESYRVVAEMNVSPYGNMFDKAN